MFRITSMHNNPAGKFTLFSKAAVLWLAGLLALLLLLGIELGRLNISVVAACVGGLALLLFVALRQDELVAALVLLVHLYVDWYLGLALVAPAITVVLLFVFYLRRSPERPWHILGTWWLWGLYLLFAIYPAVQGARSRYDAAYYYPNIILGALLMYWLGTIIARDGAALRRFFQILAVISSLLAIVTLIQSKTGTFLFATSRYETYLASVSDFHLAENNNVYRAGSLLFNPDWNGAFFAVTSLIPFGLFIETPSIMKKVIYAIEVVLLLAALLVTYSMGAWISAIAGAAIFILLLGRWNHRIWVMICLIVSSSLLLLLLPGQIALLLQRSSDPQSLLLRVGGWQTAINIIKAHPLMGIGLGLQSYLQRSVLYRASTEVVLLAHPHNSYLELGAMGGLPLLTTFVLLLAGGFIQSFRNWLSADRQLRALLGGGIAAVVALSVNSMSVNVWTLPPLAAIGWLVVGMISSPAYTTLEAI